MEQLWQAFFLGIVQGLTEFIPVSSSGHLIIAEELLATRFSGLSYDVALHLGTLAALVLYFRHDLTVLIKGLFASKREEGRLAGYLVLATIPTAVAGFYFYELVDLTLRSLWVVVMALIAVAVLMFVADRHAGGKKLEEISLKDSIVIGLAQMMSLVPGVSRAGSTIVAGSLLGLNNAEAAKFSFYLAIPVILGANLRVGFREGVFEDILASWPVFLAGALVSALVGYFVIALLLKYLSTNKLAVFAWYRIFLAVVLTMIIVI